MLDLKQLSWKDRFWPIAAGREWLLTGERGRGMSAKAGAIHTDSPLRGRFLPKKTFGWLATKPHSNVRLKILS